MIQLPITYDNYQKKFLITIKGNVFFEDVESLFERPLDFNGGR